MSSSESSVYSNNDSELYESDSVVESESYETNIDLHGDIINNYNVITKIGGGSFSNVWLVYSIKHDNFFALKVQNYDDFEEGMDEVRFLRKLQKHDYVNNIIDYFIEKRFIDEKIESFICSVYELCCMNIHDLMKIPEYTDGLPYDIAMKIFNQLCSGITFLHNTARIFHGDIKPDNILIRGINKRDQYYIDEYKKKNFMEIYGQIKKKYWLEKGKNLNNIKQMPIDVKLRIRKQVHESIMHSIEPTKYTNRDFDSTIIENIMIKISDFGSYCSDDDIMEDSFGTQYYMAPEMIVMSDCRKPVDIWALGCTLYELLTGEILFDPEGDDDYMTDLNHLKLITELCGPIKEFTKGKKYNKFYKKNKLICKCKPTETLEEFLQDKLSFLDDKRKSHVINLLLSMIKITPKKRIKINKLKEQALYTV